MKLTEKRAVELSIELWTWLAKTGKRKDKWPEWEKYGKIDASCFLCEYNGRKCGEDGQRICERCPYSKEYNRCLDEDSPFMTWSFAPTKKTRKKYASLFLEQLKAIRRG